MSKTTNFTEITFTALHHLKSFENVRDKNYVVGKFLDEYGTFLNHGTKETLKLLSRYACKFPGVAYLKIETMVDKLNISESSVHRAIKRLQDYGILEVIPTRRVATFFQGCNIYVIKNIYNESYKYSSAKFYDLINSSDPIRKKRRDKISQRLRLAVMNRDKSTCRMCGAKAPDVKIHLDHIVPVTKGGEDSFENLQCLCETCNIAKSNEITLHINDE